jgi:hypothetical protein
MADAGFLQDPSIRRWLGGVEPVWTLLDQSSFMALRRPPSPKSGSIRLAADLTNQELQQSAVARNTLILLQSAAAGPGLKMTSAGNLSRTVVSEMRERFSWPGFDNEGASAFHKVVNEPDFLPLYLVRNLTQTCQLLRRQKGYLKITALGRHVLEGPNLPGLQAVLFHLAMWHVDLAFLGRGLLPGWPQRDIGIVLWSLSIAANEWETRERLTRLCTVPINAVLDTQWDTAAYAMEATILRPLWWFGLLDHREEELAGSRYEKRHLYRKTALFDRFLSFGVAVETAVGTRH